jgi:hypothetical protein
MLLSRPLVRSLVPMLLLQPHLGAPLPEAAPKLHSRQQHHHHDAKAEAGTQLAPIDAPAATYATPASIDADSVELAQDAAACHGRRSRSRGRCATVAALAPMQAPHSSLSCRDTRSCGWALVALAAVPLGAALGASWWRARPFMLRERAARQRLASWLPEDDQGFKCVAGCLRRKVRDTTCHVRFKGRAAGGFFAVRKKLGTALWPSTKCEYFIGSLIHV